MPRTTLLSPAASTVPCSTYPRVTPAASSTLEGRTWVATQLAPSLAYSNALPDSQCKMTQAVVWNVFISDGIFCMKMCSNTVLNTMNLWSVLSLSWTAIGLSHLFALSEHMSTPRAAA